MMKKTILLATFAISMLTLQSCYTYYYEQAYTIDFREYLKNGFMISPTDTGFDYTPLGQLEVYYTLGQKIPKDYSKENLFKGWDGNYFPNSKRLMDKMVEEAKELGGDGIICFKIEYFEIKGKQPFYKATGVAVKVKR